MFNILMAILCALSALGRFGDATSKAEVASWIDKSALQARRQEAVKLSETTRKILASSTSQDQTRCVKGQLPAVHNEIDQIVEKGAESIKKEYMIMAQQKFMALQYDQIVSHIRDRFAGIKPYVEEVLKKIKKCL